MVDKEKLLDQAENIRKNYVTYNLDQDQEDFVLMDKINDLLSTIFNDNTITISYLFNPNKEKKYLWHRVKSSIIPKILPIILLLCITGFLVSEASVFYGNGQATTGAYFKAILTEICFIFMSGYRASGYFEKLVAPLVRLGIVGLMLFVITSETFLNTKKDSQNTSILSDKVELINNQIKEKTKAIDYYLKKDWPITAKQLTAEKSKLEEELLKMKTDQQNGSNKEVSKLLEYKAYGNAFFRFLLLCISMLISRRNFRF